jgi:hypothetical protein
MIEVLYTGYITDESNENGPFSFAVMFAGAQSVSFILDAHQGATADAGAVAIAKVMHCDTANGDYEDLPGASVTATGIGSSANEIKTFKPSDFKAFGRVALTGNGAFDARGAGSVAAVW